MTCSKLGSSRRSGRASPPALCVSPEPLASPLPAAWSPLVPGASPWGNSPTSALPSPWPAGGVAASPALADSEPAEPSLPGGWPAELLGELLDELLAELSEELLEELLDGLPLLLGGGVELGVEGVWGVVGVLALGQPPSTRQALAIAASLITK